MSSKVFSPLSHCGVTVAIDVTMAGFSPFVREVRMKRAGALLGVILSMWLAANIAIPVSGALAQEVPTPLLGPGAPGPGPGAPPSNDNVCLGDYRDRSTSRKTPLSVAIVDAYRMLFDVPDTVETCWLHWFSIGNIVDVSFWRNVYDENQNGGDWTDDSGNPLLPPLSLVSIISRLPRIMAVIPKILSGYYDITKFSP